MPDAIMIFAAGFGTRMMPLTRDMPKPMVAVGGRPMIDRALDLATDAGISQIVCNLHYKSEVLEAHLQGSDVVTILETPEILDTGGGLRNALPVLGKEPVYTMNPDAIWQGPNPLAYAADRWKPEDMDALLLCIRPEDARGRDATGDFTLSETGQVKRGADVLYGGVQIIKTDRLSEITEPVFSLNRLWDLLIADKRCYGCIYPGEWCDVGHPAGIGTAEDMIGWPAHD